MAKSPTAKPKSKSKSPPAKPVPHDPGRFMSQARLAAVLGRNRATVREWTDAGMPCVRRGEGAAGKDWLFDLAEVVKWREEQVAKRVRAEYASAPDADGFDPLDPLRGIKDPAERLKIQDAYLKLAKSQKYSVNPDMVGLIFARYSRDVGNSVMALPDLAERDINGYPNDMIRRFVSTCKKHCGGITASAKAAAEKSIRELFDQHDDPADDPDEDADDDEEVEE